MRIDSHQHFWTYNTDAYGWIDESMSILQRDFLPQHLAPILTEHHIDGCIAVQAIQTPEETRWLLQLTQENPFIKGVVGWVDLQSPTLESQLEQLTENGHLKGIRHVLQSEPDDQFMLRPDFLKGIATLGQHDLAYDILIFPRHLPHAIQLVDQFPNNRFVIDHLAKPFIKAQQQEPWATQIREIAKRENVFCKFSGLVTEADWKTWKPADLKPYTETAIEAFGPKRLMFGSDWPVCLLAGTYDQVLAIASETEQQDIMGATAHRFYKLD